MKNVIIVDEALTAKIEALQYEVESRKDIIAQILSGSLTVKGDHFKRYHEEYQQFFIDYNKAKQELIDAYNLQDKAWNLDFRSRQLTIE